MKNFLRDLIKFYFTLVLKFAFALLLMMVFFNMCSNC